MNIVTYSLIAAAGMVAVAGAAVILWQRLSRIQFRWFWVGAGLWTVAVALKVVCALLTNKVVLGFLKAHLSYPLQVLLGGMFFGVQSSLFEIGLTLVAVLLWRQLGRDAARAIGIGVGAGAFEALLLGMGTLAAGVVCLAGLPGADKIREGINSVASVTPLFCLIAPVERAIAIPCHAASRALVLLGVGRRSWLMIGGGFLLFTLLDGVAGAAHVSGRIGQMSMWWIELAILPFALISLPILRWCYRRWSEPGESPPPVLTA